MTNVFDDNAARAWLSNMLRNDKPITITFQKTDGTMREMKCTLNKSHMPERKEYSGEKDESKPVKRRSDDTISVYDVEKNDWRSFRWDSIHAVNFTL